MPDEDVGTHTDEFPEDEHHHEIVREDDSEHGEEEQGKAGEEPRVAFLVAHVAGGVDKDERGDCRHHEEHDLAQVVQRDADRDREFRAEIQPLQGQLRRDFGLAEQPPAQEATCCRREDREAGAQGFGEPPDEENQDRCGERRKENDPRRGLRAHQNFSVLRSST